MTEQEYQKILEAAEENLALARMIVAKKAPYLCPTIYGLIPHPEPGFGSIAVTEGMVMIYDPLEISKWSSEDLAGGLVHEARHHIGNHMARGEGMLDKDTANIAMDMTINPNLFEAGWTLPFFVIPSQQGLPDGLSLEEYYELLMEKKQQQQSEGKGQSKKSSPEEGDPPPPGGENKQEPPGKEEPAPGCGSGRCGGIASNPGQEELEKRLDAKYGRSAADVKEIAEHTLSDLQKYAEAHGRGSVPGDLLKEAEAGRKKKTIPWQQEISHLLKRASGRVESGGMDFSLARPSKRSPSRGFPRPGMVSYVPVVAFVLDTSGSMGAPQILMSFKQCIAIFISLGIEAAYLLQADAGVSDITKIRMKDLLKKVKIRGGGGTHFDPALRAVAKLKPRPDIVVYLTDGDGGVTYRPKGIEVVWCIVPGHFNKKPDVPWGHAVFIGADGKKRRKAA